MSNINFNDIYNIINTIENRSGGKVKIYIYFIVRNNVYNSRNSNLFNEPSFRNSQTIASPSVQMPYNNTSRINTTFTNQDDISASQLENTIKKILQEEFLTLILPYQQNTNNQLNIINEKINLINKNNMLLFNSPINDYSQLDITNNNNNNIQSITNDSIIKELQSKLNELSSIIETHSTSIDKLTQSNISIQNTINECNHTSSSLQTEFSSFQKQIPLITQTLNKLNINELSSLNFDDIKYIKNIKQNIININEDISSIKATIDKQKNDNNNEKIISNIENIANQIKVFKIKHDKDIQDMKMIIEQIKNDNTTHKEDVNTQNILQTIESKLDEFNNRLLSNEDSLYIKYNLFNDEIKKMLNEQQSLHQQIELLEQRINDVDNINIRLNTIEINSLNKDKVLSDLEFNVKNIQNDIHDIKGEINGLKEIDDDNDDEYNDYNGLNDFNNKNDLLFNDDEQGGFITQTGMLRNEIKNESNQNDTNNQRGMRTNILDLLNDGIEKETDMYQFNKEENNEKEEDDEHNSFDDDDDFDA